jgi:hypothetical protein
MRVQVPRDIVGGSLLGAHNWVKSTITRTNPGGSTTDYKLQQTDGTPMSLSDLTSRTFDEVLVISGNTRKNPHHNTTTNYPVAQPDWNYPSYTSNNRIGNNITKLLAKDIDPAMLSRLAAQNGMFSALNTVTKLLYSQDTDTLGSHGSDPRVVALLQTYANSQRKLGHPILRNPTRAFMGPDFNQGYRGVVSPEEAVKAFAAEQFDIHSPDITNSESMQLMDRARIIKLYDLNNTQNINNFVDDVLTTFLVVSRPNANLLKALRHIDYVEDTKKALGRHKGDYDDTPQWKKLIALLPMKAVDFYEGRDYALVAHSMFARESLATAAMDKELIKHIFDIVENHPENAGEAESPARITTTLGTNRYIEITDREFTLRSPEDRIVWDMMVAQQGILADTPPEEHIEFLRQLYHGENRDQDIAAHVSRVPTDKKISYLRDLAGFRPTPPPFWPKPVVLAMMDTLRNHIWSILDETEGPAYSDAFMNLGSLGGLRLDLDEELELKVDGKERTLSISSLKEIAEGIDLYEPKKLIEIFGREKDGKKWEKNENLAEKLPEDINDLDAEEDQMKAIEYIVIAGSGNNNFFKREMNDDIANEMKAVLYSMLYTSERNTTYQDMAGYTLNLLSLFVEVEEIARSQYNYTMTENDRAFVLFLMEEVFGIIHQRRQRSGDDGDDGPPALNNDQIANVLMGMQDPGSQISMDSAQMANRVAFEHQITEIEEMMLEQYRDYDEEELTLADIKTWANIYRNSQNWPNWAMERITQAEHEIASKVRIGMRDAGVSGWDDYRSLV